MGRAAMRDWKSTCGIVMLAAFVVAHAGCSDGRLPTHPVSGKVVFADGSPVHVGTVELKSREHSIHARGTINSDGRFVLTTYESGDGAVAGMHDCVVVQMVMVEGIANFHPSTEGVVHPQFGSYATSGLAAEVSDKGPNELQLQVTPLSKSESTSSEPHRHHEHSGRPDVEQAESPP